MIVWHVGLGKPATGETEIQGQLLGRLTIWAQSLERSTSYVCYACILTGGPPSCSAGQGRKMRTLRLSVCLWVLWVSVECVPGRVYVYTCICGVCVFYMYVPTGNTSSVLQLAGPGGTWSCSILSCQGVLDIFL